MSSPGEVHRILIIEDCPMDAALLTRWLGPAMAPFGDWAADVCRRLQDARERLEERDYTLAFLDLNLPDARGAQLIEAVSEQAQVPVIAVTGADGPELEALAADYGLQDYLTKAELSQPRLLARVVRFALQRARAARQLEAQAAELRKANDRLARLARTDPLTGLRNRRGLQDALRTGFARHEQMSLLLADLDGFKGINDAYGHDVGDRVLVAFANALRTMVRHDDVIARTGGDEFVVVLPSTDAADCRVLATRLRRHLASLSVDVSPRGFELVVGVSLGQATLATARGTPDDLLHDADIDMYRHKAARKATGRRAAG